MDEEELWPQSYGLTSSRECIDLGFWDPLGNFPSSYQSSYPHSFASNAVEPLAQKPTEFASVAGESQSLSDVQLDNVVYYPVSSCTLPEGIDFNDVSNINGSTGWSLQSEPSALTNNIPLRVGTNNNVLADYETSLDQNIAPPIISDIHTIRYPWNTCDSIGY